MYEAIKNRFSINHESDFLYEQRTSINVNTLRFIVSKIQYKIFSITI